MNTEEFTGLYKQLGTVVLNQQALIEALTQRVEQLETALQIQLQQASDRTDIQPSPPVTTGEQPTTDPRSSEQDDLELEQMMTDIQNLQQ